MAQGAAGLIEEAIMQINCYAAFTPGGMLKPYTYETKPLGDWEVLIKVTHCGICHSDVHLINGDWGTDIYPLVPGHEAVGLVESVGRNVKHLKEGQRVGVGWQSGSCMKCEWCKSGEENLCSKNQATCVGHNGGFGEYLATDSRFAFPIPDGLASENAAPLLCGGATVYSPLKRWGAGKGVKVGVIGIGGLGHLALQFARAFGCEVTAFSSTPSKMQEATGFGARKFVFTKDTKSMTQAAGTLDLLVSTINAPADWDKYMKLLRPNGKLLMLGAVPEPVSVSAMSLIVGQKAVIGSCIGGRPAISEMLAFAARHKVQAKTEVMPIVKVNEAVKKVKENKARYRMVLATSTS